MRPAPPLLCMPCRWAMLPCETLALPAMLWPAMLWPAMLWPAMLWSPHLQALCGATTKAAKLSEIASQLASRAKVPPDGRVQGACALH